MADLPETRVVNGRSPTKKRTLDTCEKTDSSQLEPLGWFMVRTPVLPFENWMLWTGLADPVENSGASTDFETAITKTRHELKSGLASRLTPLVTEGLYLASPSLSAKLPDWLEDQNAATLRGLENSLVAYFSRLTGRPTPFGAFSAVALGEFGQSANMTITDDSAYRRTTRIGLRYLRRLMREVLNRPESRRIMRYVANPTIYGERGDAHYLKRIEATRGDTTLQPAVFRMTARLRQVLSTLGPGKTQREIAMELAETGSHEKLSNRDGSLPDTISTFVEQLIESQILVPVLSPVLDCFDPTQALIAEIRRIPALSSISDELLNINTELRELDAQGLGQPVPRYHALAKRLSALCDDGKTSGLFFVDVDRPTPLFSLPKQVASEILDGVQLLSAISRENDSTLDRFAERFLERFGTQHVPLLDLFDVDFNFDFDTLHSGASWQARDAHLLRRVSETLAVGSMSLQFSEQDIGILRRADEVGYPACLAVLSTLIANREQDIADGNYQFFVEGITRATGILGRFAGLDQHWQERVAGLARREQGLAGEAVLADVIYDPPGEPASNFLCRPALTAYSIPFLASSSSAGEFQIRLTDLYICVREGRIFLWSKRLHKEVVPVHNSAYAFHHPGNPPVLRLLCRLATGNSRVAWDWGEVLESLPFLPRVEYRRLIISRARWRISSEELNRIRGLTDAARMEEIKKLRTVRRLPRQISLAQNDRRLTVDFSNILSVRTFLGLTKDEQNVSVTEVLPGPEQLCVRGPEGRFQHELVIPASFAVQRSSVKSKNLWHNCDAPMVVPDRQLPFNSDWLYIKIYTRRSAMDLVLANAISPLVRELADADVSHEWFFIRYTDPYHHLRVRFHLVQRSQAARAFAAAGKHLSALIEQGLIWKWQVDTYEREMDKYSGQHGIRAAEQLFWADSVLSLRHIERCSTLRAREEALLPMCMLSIDRLFQDFNCDIQTRHKLVTELAGALNDQNSKALGIALGNEFRLRRRKIESALANLHADVAGLLDERSLVVRLQARELTQLYAEGKLDQAVISMLKHFIHLNANRLMKMPVKQEEIRLYAFLQRLYKSYHARGVTGLIASDKPTKEAGIRDHSPIGEVVQCNS